MPQNFHVDLISFALGFVVASLLWWLSIRFKSLLPALWARIKKMVLAIRQRNLEGADAFLRRDTLRRAQKMHIAASLFALDEILIEPVVLAPPAQIEPDLPAPHESVAAQTMPYLPDWPELASNIGPLTYPLATALQQGSNILVVGQPGSGKTVALAALACQFARQDPNLGKLKTYLPVHFHILDLDQLDNTDNPLASILRIFVPRVALVYQGQLARLITTSFEEGTAVLILDGLDEIPPSELISATNFIRALHEIYPLLRMVCAASPYKQPGITGLGFVPLGLAAWGVPRRHEFLALWKALWEQHVAPQVAAKTSLSISPLLVDNWLKGDRGYFTPLEWTARVWGAYAGDLRQGVSSPFETLITRVSNSLPKQALLESLAREFIHKGHSALPYTDLVSLLNGLSPATPVFTEPANDAEEGEPHPTADKQKKGAKGRRDMMLSVGEQTLEAMVKSGLMVEHRGTLLRFATPVLTGYLAAPLMNEEDVEKILEAPSWSVHHATLRFVTSIGEYVSWIETYIKADREPLQEHLLAAARWLGDSSGNTLWRSLIFRGLANGVNDETSPLSLRARMVTAFVCSNDPSAPKFFKQLLTAKQPEVRLLGVLATGAWGDSALAGDLMGMLGDVESSVRHAACLALVSLHSESALSAVAECMMNGDEALRQAAAEALIFLPKQGVDIIREAAKLDDLLTRRAAVFALMQIREPWSKELLDHLAVEDAQWVVRNAAAQALETIQEIDPRVPKPLPAPHESPWLISFAGKRNLGLSPAQPPTDALLLALKSGTVEDQMAALRYLKFFPEEKVIQAVILIFYGDQPELRDAALLVIWNWSLSGIPIPYLSTIGVNY